MKVKITGNISNYEQKTVGFFTTRQLIFSIVGLITGIISFFLMGHILPTIFSTLLAAIVGFFVAALGILEYGGLPLSELVLRVLKLAAGQGKRMYKTDEIYMEAEDEQKR